MRRLVVDGGHRNAHSLLDGRWRVLRLAVDSKIVMLARSVKYGPQPADLFDVPKGYEPALAPAGGAAD